MNKPQKAFGLMCLTALAVTLHFSYFKWGTFKWSRQVDPPPNAASPVVSPMPRMLVVFREVTLSSRYMGNTYWDTSYSGVCYRGRETQAAFWAGVVAPIVLLLTVAFLCLGFLRPRSVQTDVQQTTKPDEVVGKE